MQCGFAIRHLRAKVWKTMLDSNLINVYRIHWNGGPTKARNGPVFSGIRAISCCYITSASWELLHKLLILLARWSNVHYYGAHYTHYMHVHVNAIVRATLPRTLNLRLSDPLESAHRTVKAMDAKLLPGLVMVRVETQRSASTTVRFATTPAIVRVSPTGGGTPPEKVNPRKADSSGILHSRKVGPDGVVVSHV